MAAIGIAAYLVARRPILAARDEAPVARRPPASAGVASGGRHDVDNGRGIAPLARHGGDADGGGAAAVASAPDRDAIDGEHVLRFYNAGDMAAFAAAAEALGARVIGRLAGRNLLRVRVDTAAQWEALLARGPTPMEHTANHIVHVPERVASPEAPAGVTYTASGGGAVAALGQEGVAALPGGAVRVAILDTGVLPHWAYAGATLEYIDVLGGDVGDAALSGHGSAVASIVAGNDPRLPGVAPGVELLSVRVMDGAGAGDAFTVAAGIIAAVDAGARVINLSLGTQGDNLALREAVAYAEARGVVVVAAVGNDGIASVTYPAAYPTALAVGTVDGDGRVLYFSNTGDAVDIMAPGYGVYTAWTNDQVVAFSGSSASTPFVSGAAARLISADPGLSPAEVRATVKQVADDAGEPGADGVYGAGVLDLGRLAAVGTAGIHDIAARPPYVLSGTALGDAVRVACYVQNVGTETAGVVELTVTMGDASFHFSGFNLAPGATFARDVRAGVVSRADRRVPFRVFGTLRSAADAVPANDAVSGTLTIFGKAEQAE